MVADGTEEIEVMTVFDLCVRASMLVTVCSISPFASPSESLGWITLSRGAKLVADVRFDDFKPEWEDEFDAVVVSWSISSLYTFCFSFFYPCPFLRRFLSRSLFLPVFLSKPSFLCPALSSLLVLFITMFKYSRNTVGADPWWSERSRAIESESQS